MRVVLINMRTSYIMSIPFGITYLGAVLREHGYEVKLYDVYPDDDTNKIIKELLDSFIPDLIGISVLTTNFFSAKSFISDLKNNFPRAIFCAGGIHPTVRPRETVEVMGLDFVVIGEGENTLLKVCERLKKSKDLSGLKGIAFGSGDDFYINFEIDIVSDLDSLPFPARELLPVDRYLIPPGYIRSHFLNRVMSILTSRGCPAKCTFCNSSSIFHNRVRRRSVNNVMGEITYFVHYYNLDGIYFHDETFATDHKWAKNLCRQMQPLGLKWGCQSRVNLVNDDILQAMKDAGCIQIDFGIESASKNMLKSLKKGTTPEQAMNALRLTKKYNIKSFASFMLGLPGETEEDMIENVRFLSRIKPNFTYFNLYTPFPGTEATEIAIRDGVLPPDFFHRNYDMLLETVPLVNLSSVPTETVIKYHRKLRNMVFLNNYLGVLNKNNICLIIEVLYYFLLSPRVVFKSVSGFIKNRNIENFIFCIFSNYQKQKMRKNKKS